MVKPIKLIIAVLYFRILCFGGILFAPCLAQADSAGAVGELFKCSLSPQYQRMVNEAAFSESPLMSLVMRSKAAERPKNSLFKKPKADYSRLEMAYFRKFKLKKVLRRAHTLTGSKIGVNLYKQSLDELVDLSDGDALRALQIVENELIDANLGFFIPIKGTVTPNDFMTTINLGYIPIDLRFLWSADHGVPHPFQVYHLLKYLEPEFGVGSTSKMIRSLSAKDWEFLFDHPSAPTFDKRTGLRAFAPFIPSTAEWAWQEVLFRFIDLGD